MQYDDVLSSNALTLAWDNDQIPKLVEKFPKHSMLMFYNSFVLY